MCYHHVLTCVASSKENENITHFKTGLTAFKQARGVVTSQNSHVPQVTYIYDLAKILNSRRYLTVSLVVKELLVYLHYIPTY